ncbi:hypothetical protein [Frankia sp. Cas3]|nr:hypothetical protein [Frankia sp. Cas3]
MGLLASFTFRYSSACSGACSGAWPVPLQLRDDFGPGSANLLRNDQSS